MQLLCGKQFTHIEDILTAVQQEVAEILSTLPAFPVFGNEP
jgi:hypothetical protein